MRKPRADKGVKRGRYKRNEFREAADALRELKRVQRERGGRPRHERREERRLRLLPADRVCPICLKMKLDSRQWVVLYGTRCVCLGCYRTHGRDGCGILLPRPAVSDE